MAGQVEVDQQQRTEQRATMRRKRNIRAFIQA